MMLSIGAAEFFSSGKVSGSPLSSTVLDKKERLLSAYISLHCAADYWTGTRQVL